MRNLYGLFAVILILPFLMCGVYAQNVNKVVDDASLLSSYEKEDLENKIDDIIKKYSFDVVIVTSDNIGSKTPEQFADDYFDYNGYGIGQNRNGILLLIAMDKRKYHISTTGYGIKAFSDNTIREMGSSIESYLKNKNYYGAFESYLNYVDRYLNMKSNNSSDLTSTYYEGKSSSQVLVKLGIIVFSSFLVSLIILTIMRRRMKTARPKNYAGNYIKNFKLKRQQDIFLRRTVNRVRRSQSDSSGSSGSTTHTSSSGTSHGGGGGSF